MITQCPKTGRTCEVTGCAGCWKDSTTQDEIIRMAREAGFEGLIEKAWGIEHLERFAALVAAHEREKLTAEQEPVCIDWDTKTDEPIMGYAAPVRTKDLTDDEIAMCMGKDLWNVYKNEVDFARAVIAADREKNK